MTKKGLTITINIGLEDGGPGSQEISLKLDNYLVPGSVIDEDPTHCYPPIFLHTSPLTIKLDQVEQREFKSTWFLGNIFLDKYFVSTNAQAFNNEKSNRL